MNNAHKPVVLPHLLKQFARRASRGIHALPLGPDAECLLAPRPETDSLDNSGRHDLLAGESAPCHGVDALLVCGLESARSVGSKIRDLVVGFEDRLQALPIRGRDEELDERLLEDEAVLGTPAEDFVVAGYAVYCGLRRDGQPAVVD